MAAGYVEINRANWDSRVPAHAQGYGLEKFRAEPEWLSQVVRFDQARLGDVRGLELLHLQCHIGTDTLSLARLGAKATGLDFSAPALSVARDLARDCGAAVTYVEAILAAGLRLVAFEEHQSVPWDPFGAAGVRDGNGEYRLRERPDRIPATYTLQAIKE